MSNIAAAEGGGGGGGGVGDVHSKLSMDNLDVHLDEEWQHLRLPYYKESQLQSWTPPS